VHDALEARIQPLAYTTSKKAAILGESWRNRQDAKNAKSTKALVIACCAMPTLTLGACSDKTA